MGDEEQGSSIDTGRLLDMLDYLEREVRRAEQAGVNLSEVEGMLAGARMMIESGEFRDASDIVGQCMQAATKRFAEHETLARAIKKAEDDVLVARGEGRDIADACRHLKLARECLEDGNYMLGIDSAKRASEELAHKKPAEIAWGSAVCTDDDV